MKSLIGRELKALWNDPWQFALVTYIPILGIISLWWLFSAGMPRQLPVAIVDHDQSQVSRMLTRRIQANPAAKTIGYQDIAGAKRAMTEGEVYALVVLPHRLNRDLLTGHSPTIEIRYNSQFLLVGKLLSSQIQLSLSDGLLHAANRKQLALGVPKAQAEINLRPVTSQTTALYNSNSNYIGFLVPPVLLALGQLLAMLVFANSLNRELRLNTMSEWFTLGTRRVLFAKMLVYTPLIVLQGRFILAVLYQFLNLPLAGDFGLLLVAQVAMLLAVWLLVLVIFFLLQDCARVISFCTALFAPAFPFMGITFPTLDMPILAQLWRKLMPSSHYIDTHVGVVSYGQGWDTLADQLINYWGFLFLIPVIVFLATGVKRAHMADKSLSPEATR
ncbi:ABC transporter permease [uncultured Shewanella sp.]|uniref:ABC transporter permease n=1 Tax=Shewanella atlantica TaxID=271099 RepID=UPI002612002B|nr:ABC transporter permease [uncultured Shewanella sp.]